MTPFTVKAHLTQVDTRTRKALSGDLIEIEVEIELNEFHLDRSLREQLPEIARQAGLNAASRRVSYDDYPSDDAYRNTLEAAAGDYYLEAVEIGGAVQKEYVVEGVYSNDGGLWGDTVTGVNASEAEFQAAWVMACNAGCELDPVNSTPQGWIKSLLAHMDAQRIETVQIKGPGEVEAFDALTALHGAATAAGLSGEEVDGAGKILSDRRSLADRIRNDRIEFLDTASAPAP